MLSARCWMRSTAALVFSSFSWTSFCIHADDCSAPDLLSTPSPGAGLCAGIFPSASSADSPPIDSGCAGTDRWSRSEDLQDSADSGRFVSSAGSTSCGNRLRAVGRGGGDTTGTHPIRLPCGELERFADASSATICPVLWNSQIDFLLSNFDSFAVCKKKKRNGTTAAGRTRV